jgi:hypothetical protein
MTNHQLGWTVLGLAAAGFGLWQGTGEPLHGPAALMLILAAVVGAVWLSRVRAARRLLTASNAYAERVLAQERRRRKRTRPSASRVA